jgi:predicted RNase H-like HicB family nuclease
LREFSVLIRPARDLPGQWVAHCLNWDLVSQGESPSHATRMIAEAVLLAIEEDLAADLDPNGRKPAPAELWELFWKTQQTGTRIAPADVDTIPGSPVIATVMYLMAEPQAAEAPHEDVSSWVPPPFVIAAIRDSHRPVHG